MKIAVIGNGIVGKGTLAALAGKDIEVAYIIDINNADEYPKILADESVKLVAELINGEHPAFEYVESAMKAGKHVVTSNKQMLSKHYAYLINLAKEMHVRFAYSVTAGGGIPWLYNLLRMRESDTIKSISGVMNGTTNFILERMARDDMEFDDALRLAQKLGYAEANPTLDIEGLDVRAKLAISCNVAWGGEMDPATIPTTGITGVTKEDVKNAMKEGKMIRLVARAVKNEDGTINASIKPEAVDATSPFYTLMDAENCFAMDLSRGGVFSFRGAGAGGGASGDAVAADIFVIKNRIEG